MSRLAWNWLCLPYLACALALISVAVVAAVVRGDRVLRLGAITAATNAVPWALCSALATWTTDPETATRLLKLGNGPLALVGPSLLLVMLGVSGQLERHRWIVRIAGAIGLVMLVVCWASNWVVAGVHRLSSGILYLSPGPLTAAHFAQIAIWLAAGLAIARRSTSGRERRGLVRIVVGVLVLGAIGSSDLLLVYGVIDGFPVMWLAAGIVAAVAAYYELTSDLLRPQGLDRDVIVELVAFAASAAAVAGIVVALDGTRPIAIAASSSVVWTIALGIAWTRSRGRSAPIASERALERFVASPDLDSDAKIAEQLAALWSQIGIELRALERVDDAARAVPADVAAWLVDHGDAVAANDLGTMSLGAIRPKLENLVGTSGARLLVPLIDRGILVGLAEAEHGMSLREDLRGLVVESARATARALTYVALAQAAAHERETAREVEVAEALRLQASASRDDQLGRWVVAAEYRSAPRTTGAAGGIGAGWSAKALVDGRLAVLVTEAQSHGVPAALATAALTGAFAAATVASDRLELGELFASLRASAARGGEPVATFVAILDGDRAVIEWASIGHRGATLVDRDTAVLLSAETGTANLPRDALVVVASNSVRGGDDDAWRALVRDGTGAGQVGRGVLEAALARDAPRDDLLVVVIAGGAIPIVPST